MDITEWKIEIHCQPMKQNGFNLEGLDDKIFIWKAKDNWVTSVI